MIKNTCTLREILCEVENERLSLPTVQRGFVWRPYQIENLWDSLLRGYPVGSFVVAQKRPENGDDHSNIGFELLDGQQRATAICLGFGDPLEKNKIKSLKRSNQDICVFIDLKKPDANDSRKYLFRVITRSHPWGYRRRENQKTLETRNIAAAIRAYGLTGQNCLSKPLNRFWPYDAERALPLGFFLHSSNLVELNSKIERWELSLKPTWPRQTGCLYTVEEIFEAVTLMLEHQRVPLVELPLEQFFRNKVAILPTPEDKLDTLEAENDYENISNDMLEVEHREDLDEIENLFIRLNAGGTPLRGEELNYSMLKTRISSALQNNIEKSCLGLFTPSRFITIAYRLFQNKNIVEQKMPTDERDVFTMRIKPSQFKNFHDSSKFAKFCHFLELLVKEKALERVKKILSYDADNPYGLPAFIVSRLGDSAPEIMFMLLYRLLIKDDWAYVTPETDNHRRALGLLTLFAWLGKGGVRRDHSRILANIGDRLKETSPDLFWSKTTVYLAANEYREMRGLILPPASNRGSLNYFLPHDESKQIKSMDFGRFTQKEKGKGESYEDFISTMFFNRDLVLYAQRSALHEWFSGQDMSYIEDTNRPFDYDHISPQKLVYRKWHISDALKSWYNTNGNIRAWPYSLNRKDQALAASSKLNCDRLYFEQEIAEAVPACRLYEKRILFKWSCCDYAEFNDLREDDAQNQQTAQKILRVIRGRNIALLNIWYKDLLVKDLVPNSWPVNTEE